MAFITAERTRAIKKALTKAYPDYKFSVRNENYSSVNVTIVSGPLRFDYTEESRRRANVSGMNNIPADPPNYLQLNNYYLENYENSDVLEGMYKIINEGNYDNSDIMTDYFDVGFYVHFNMGAWDKPYVLTK